MKVRVLLVSQQKIDPFIQLARSDLLDYRRTAAVSFASFTLHEVNKPLLVQAGAITAMLALGINKLISL
jgi:hypothetical protein